MSAGIAYSEVYAKMKTALVGALSVDVETRITPDKAPPYVRIGPGRRKHGGSKTYSGHKLVIPISVFTKSGGFTELYGILDEIAIIITASSFPISNHNTRIRQLGDAHCSEIEDGSEIIQQAVMNFELELTEA